MEGWRTETSNPEQTRRLAALLGRLLSRPMVLLLSGPLGAGKTCFVQGLARGLGVAEDEPVTSPSFALMNQYSGRHLPLFHFDLYRLTTSGDLEELGLEEYLEGQGIAVIEWAERLEARNTPALRIELEEAGGERRRVRFAAGDGDQGQLLDRLAGLWCKEREGEA